MNGTFEAGRCLRRLGLAIGLAALLGGCAVIKVTPGGGPRADVKVAPPTELTCGVEGAGGGAERCVVRVSVWTEGNTCQFSFAPDGLRIKGRLGPTQVRFVLNDVHNEGFAWVPVRGEPGARGPIEFQARDARGRWVPDPTADRAFPVNGRQVRGAELIVPTTNVRRAEPPGAERYPYILRVVRRGTVCESPDPWIWPGES